MRKVSVRTPFHAPAANDIRPARNVLTFMDCNHNKRIGDNYGITCQDCREVLEGYGYGGWFGGNLIGNERCIHGEYAWYKINDVEEQCMYCETIRERAKMAN